MLRHAHRSPGVAGTCYPMRSERPPDSRPVESGAVSSSRLALTLVSDIDMRDTLITSPPR